MSRAVLSIGSNVGDSENTLRSVVRDLGSAVIAVSGLYGTAPWGGVEQQDFLNAALLVEDPSVDSWGWLRRGQELEQAAHRVRVRTWGPRTLDVDVVAVWDVVDGSSVPVRSDDPELRLPHPHAGERAFVLIPWLDVQPDAELNGTRVDRVLADLPAAERAGVRLVEREWSVRCGSGCEG